MSSTRYSYYFPPFNTDVLKVDTKLVAEHGFISLPNHYVNVDLSRSQDGGVAARISINLPSGNHVSTDALPVIRLSDGTEFKFQSHPDGTFTTIDLNPGEVSRLELVVNGKPLGDIIVDDSPQLPGVAVRFMFDVGTPIRK